MAQYNILGLRQVWFRCPCFALLCDQGKLSSLNAVLGRMRPRKASSIGDQGKLGFCSFSAVYYR